MSGKGGQSTTQSQTSTYQPNPQAAGYINNALQQGQAAAQSPFQQQVAPVAGFSNDQQHAFNTVRGAQGLAQPYFNQAANYYSPQGAQSFLNPYAANVMANMQDVFGQQQSQNNGSLVQSAGGIGADRIAVGQANLAKQQGLAAGQTMAGLYSQAVQQAQQAGQNTAQLGQQSQNAALQGAQAQLGMGGLQQQLQQAQLNAPYQWDLARLQYPFQTSQFNAGITGALAPGLGGTTYGNGSTTPPPPSMLSQVLGAGTAGVGMYGGLNQAGAFGNKGSGGTYNLGDLGGGGFPSGITNGYDEGGVVGPSPYDLPPEFSDKPINIAAQHIVPDMKLTPMQPHIPQLAPPPQQQKESGGIGDVIGTAMKFLPLLLKQGGRVDPYYFNGGAPSFDDRFDAAFPARDPAPEPAPEPEIINPGEPYRMPSQGDVDAQRSADASMSYAPTVGGTRSLPPQITSGAPGARRSPYAPAPMEATEAAPEGGYASFAKSPWAALTAAGLGMMAGTSPYAGVNIGHGGMQGLKMMEEQRAAGQKDTSIDQAAKRLAQEAKFHEDQFTRISVGQRLAQQNADRPYREMTVAQKAALDSENYAPAGSIMTKDGLHIALFDKKSGRVIDGNTGKPPEATDHVIPKGGSRNSPEEIESVVDGIISGQQPPTTSSLYGDSIHVKAGLQKAGFDLSKAQIEWKRAEKLTASVNAPRMVAYVGLNESVSRTIDEVRELSKQMQLGGIPLLNKAKLSAYIQTEGNSEKGQLATKYMTAVNTLKEEFANLATGGYAPTEAAWKLANDQINGNYGMQQLHASIDEIQRLIRYRLQAVPGLETLGPGAANRYTGKGAAAAPGAGKPDVTTRFNELTKTKTEAEAYAILHAEGYQ